MFYKSKYEIPPYLCFAGKAVVIVGIIVQVVRA